MFGILLLFTLSSSQLPFQFQSAVNLPSPQVDLLASETQVIETETCQSDSLHNFDLLDIEGHKVNKLIYLQTKTILQKSRTTGLKMGLASTFRSCSEQAQLRQSNCASNTTSAESCNPPTEKPGDSLHNYGMAIDFQCSGYPVFGQSPCYNWLKEHASEYKFKQRAEEPWHWSFTAK